MSRTEEFFVSARGIAFNFVQLQITMASLEEFSLDNSRYDEIAFQVEHMQTTFPEQVRQFAMEFGPDNRMGLGDVAQSQ